MHLAIWLNMQCWIAHFFAVLFVRKKDGSRTPGQHLAFCMQVFPPCFNSVYLMGLAVIYLDLQEADILSLISGTVSHNCGLTWYLLFDSYWPMTQTNLSKQCMNSIFLVHSVIIQFCYCMLNWFVPVYYYI